VQPCGELSFQFTDGYALFVHVFRADDCAGEPQETDEATPLWTPLGEIPFEQMWADDDIWFPLLLARKSFSGRFLFDGDALLGYNVEAQTANGD
ncbi:MAG: NUDIX hydrolase, partial [Chloroflexi bacterium]|nr:NUDIX hydrolase [Chloroflexota bacterium]